jgi:hypothetical protein
MNCGTCKWFHRDGDAEFDSFGRCYVRPPVAIASRDTVLTVRPRVREDEHCKEFNVKETV